MMISVVVIYFCENFACPLVVVFIAPRGCSIGDDDARGVVRRVVC